MRWVNGARDLIDSMELKRILLQGISGVGAVSRSMLSLVYPQRCHSCGDIIEPGRRWICGACERCLAHSDFGMHPLDNAMSERFRDIFCLKGVASYLLYSPGSVLSQLLYDCKYRGYRGIARELGRLAARDMSLMPFFDGVEILLPVPMHYTKRLRRGFNQTELISKGISDVLGCRVSHDALVAQHVHRSQVSLSGEKRCNNLREVFKYKPSEADIGRHVIIVDDICTTGTTLHEAALAVLEGDPSVRLSLFTIGCTI